MRNTDDDYAGTGIKGSRTDGRNLINDWDDYMKSKNLSHKFVWNAEGLRNLDANKVEYAFGMFE